MISGKRLISRLLALSLVCAAPLGLICATPLALAADWGLPQLMAGFAAVEESRARFQEEKHLAILTEPLRLSGTLRYVRPDRIEKHITQPYAESMRIEGDRLEWESQGKTRILSLRSQPQLWALAESLRGTLAGDLAALQKHYRIKLDGTPAQWQLTLEPRYDSLAQFVEEIRMQGRNSQLRQVDIIEANGSRSQMRIEEAAN